MNYYDKDYFYNLRKKFDKKSNKNNSLDLGSINNYDKKVLSSSLSIKVNNLMKTISNSLNAYKKKNIKNIYLFNEYKNNYEELSRLYKFIKKKENIEKDEKNLLLELIYNYKIKKNFNIDIKKIKKSNIFKNSSLIESNVNRLKSFYILNYDDIFLKHNDGKIWLHTGDIGCMDYDGFVYYKQRLKRMIVSSGYNIYPSYIENIIKQNKYVDTCVVVGIPHPYKKQVAKAYIVLKNNVKVTTNIKKEIKKYCEDNLVRYSWPYEYEYRDELPKTLVGKVAYRRLEGDEKK